MLQLLGVITENLETLEIDYMLTGSLAMGFYSIQRTTRDIDIVIELRLEQLDVFINAFQERFYCHQLAIQESLKHKMLFNLIDTQTGFKIDFIPLKNTPYELQKFSNKKRKFLFTKEAWVISIEDLIISKLAWIQDLVSERQIEDIQNLLLNETIDKFYINFWIKELSLKTYNINFS